MANNIGILCKLYYNTATFGTPTWVEIPLVNDLKQTAEWSQAPVMSRASRIELTVPTTFKLSYGGTLRTKVADTIYLAIRTAFLAGTTFDILALTDGSTVTGALGYRYEALVGGMNQDQSSKNALYDDFTITPHGNSANAVQSAIVTAGAPVFTTM